MIDRFPDDERTIASWEALTSWEEPIEQDLRALAAPLLFAKHEGCLISTEEDFEDAVAAFPEAMTVVVDEAPSVSEQFAAALREFCEANASG
jgi:hypothetical protein